MDDLDAHVEVRDGPANQVQVLRPVGLVDAAEGIRRRSRTGRRYLEVGAQRRRPKMPVSDVAARLARKMKLAVRVDIAVGKETAHLIAADRIAGVDIDPQIILADRRRYR